MHSRRVIAAPTRSPPSASPPPWNLKAGVCSAAAQRPAHLFLVNFSSQSTFVQLRRRPLAANVLSTSSCTKSVHLPPAVTPKVLLQVGRQAWKHPLALHLHSRRVIARTLTLKVLLQVGRQAQVVLLQGLKRLCLLLIQRRPLGSRHYVHVHLRVWKGGAGGRVCVRQSVGLRRTQPASRGTSRRDKTPVDTPRVQIQHG